MIEKTEFLALVSSLAKQQRDKKEQSYVRCHIKYTLRIFSKYIPSQRTHKHLLRRESFDKSNDHNYEMFHCNVFPITAVMRPSTLQDLYLLSVLRELSEV